MMTTMMTINRFWNNMTRTELENLWTGLQHTGQSEFEFCRIDSICIPELSIGLNSALERCLVLELPQEANNIYPDVEKENLSMQSFPDTGYIVIQLTEAWYHDLFDDLVLSIYCNIGGLTEPAEYTARFIQTFNKWSGFFDERRSNRLPVDSVYGLMGELTVLRVMLERAQPGRINDILFSWRGPYDQVRDFMTDVADIEVKTILGGSAVRISSEHQLEPEPGKELNLAVVILELDLVNGLSLKMMVSELRDQIDAQLGDPAILFDALLQKGLTLRNLSEYENLRYRPTRITWYDCLMSGFPFLVSSMLPPGVYGLTYRLRLSVLDGYIIETKEL